MSKTENEQQNSTKKTKKKSTKSVKKNTKWIRNCPNCNKIITYSDTWYFTDSIKKNRKCTKCKDKRSVTKKYFGKDNPNYKGKMDKLFYNRNCPNCDRIITYTSYETYRKAKRNNRGCGCITKTSWACYNSDACRMFDEINRELGWNGQHALRGGERKVSKYWVDYYEPTLNIVIEYDESWHKYHKNYDDKRQEEIKKYLGCKFYRIKEGQDWRNIIYENGHFYKQGELGNANVAR